MEDEVASRTDPPPETENGLGDYNVLQKVSVGIQEASRVEFCRFGVRLLIVEDSPDRSVTTYTAVRPTRNSPCVVNH